MTKAIQTHQTRCQAAVARCDITPPVGIYHRMWGAANHERATGVHRPLLATLLWLQPETGDVSQAMVIVCLDHCILDGADLDQMRVAVARATYLRSDRVLVSLAHTHAAGLMSRSRADCEGGELIGPYLDRLAEQLAQLAAQAAVKAQPATIVYGMGCCNLAANRDFFDEERRQFVCGFNPDGIADDTVMVARLVGDTGQPIATIVNYACHPTTLAWQNTLISPDYVGALREAVEQHIAVPCLFLQGASADLGPREGFIGDPQVADRNGRQLAFAALSVLEWLPPPNTQFAYAGPVISGATIGTWRHEPLDAAAVLRSSTWHVVHRTTPLAYRPDLPSREQTHAELERWRKAESLASAAGQIEQARDAHARAEQATRQLWRLSALPHDRFPLPITVARLGDAIWVFVAGEHYQSLQVSLRKLFPGHPIIVATLSNGWQPGYMPPAEVYGRGIYQEQIAVVAAGSAEQVQEAAAEMIQESLSSAVG